MTGKNSFRFAAFGAVLLALFIFTFVCQTHATTAMIRQNSTQSQEPGLEEYIRRLAVEIADQMKQRQIKKIAIDDFTDLNGYKSALGDFISEELVTSFYTQGLGNFDVIERRELARVLKEQKLGSTGLLNKETIAKIGEILGVEAIVTGSIAYLGSYIKINARMIGVDNAKIFAAAASKIPKDATVEELLRQSSRPGSSSGPSGVQVQRFDTYFQNEFLRVEPKAINKSKDKKQITVSLLFRNISKEKIFLGMKNRIKHNSGPAMVTLDNYQGELLFAERPVSGIPCVLYWKELDKYVAISSGSQTVLICSFKSKHPIYGNVFSFSAEIVKHSAQGEKYSRFSVGIPNIEIR